MPRHFCTASGRPNIAKREHFSPFKLLSLLSSTSRSMGNQIHPIAFLTLTSKHKQLLWSSPSPHRKQSTRLSTSRPVQDATFFPWITTERLRHPLHTAAAAKSLQSCPTLCNPIDGSPPSSLVPGILQARTLEWVAISFSNA